MAAPPPGAVLLSSTPSHPLHATLASPNDTPLFPWRADGRGDVVLSALGWLAQFMQDTSELVVIVFAAWAAIDLKDRVFRWITGMLSKG